MKYQIRWKTGKVITEAPNIEEAIKKFKELRIEVPDKEISIASFGKQVNSRLILSRIILVRDFFLNKYTNIFLYHYLYINLRIERTKRLFTIKKQPNGNFIKNNRKQRNS